MSTAIEPSLHARIRAAAGCGRAATPRRVILSVMGVVDPEEERKRLAKHYASMTEGELEQFALNAFELTDVAREALRSEIAGRGLELPLNEATPVAAPEWRKPVTLRQFRDFPDAQLAKSILDAASIPCFLADENTVRMDWFYSNAIGGIKLWVNEEDAEAAAALLDAEIPKEFTVEGVGEYEQPRCPKCQSLDISFADLDKPPTYAGFFASLPIPCKPSLWKCNSCGNEWQDPGDEES